jgi:hypothetical protein
VKTEHGDTNDAETRLLGIPRDVWVHAYVQDGVSGAAAERLVAGLFAPAPGSSGGLRCLELSALLPLARADAAIAREMLAAFEAADLDGDAAALENVDALQGTERFGAVPPEQWEELRQTEREAAADVRASVAAIHHCGLADRRPVPEVLRRRRAQGTTPGVPIKGGGTARLRREAAPVRRAGSPDVATSAASCDSRACL